MAPPAWLCLFPVLPGAPVLSMPGTGLHLKAMLLEGLGWDVGNFAHRENHDKNLASLELPLEAVSSACTAVCLA